jgi:hypothetical protein
MVRLIFALCHLLAVATPGFGQDYKDIIEHQEKGPNGPTSVTGTAVFKKFGDTYEMQLSVKFRREVAKGEAIFEAVLILLDDKGEPIRLMGRACGGSTENASAGSAQCGQGISAKEFHAANGYAFIAKSTAKADFPRNIADVKDYLKKEVPSWKQAAKVYDGLRAGDESKTVGPILLRRLK